MSPTQSELSWKRNSCRRFKFRIGLAVAMKISIGGIRLDSPTTDWSLVPAPLNSMKKAVQSLFKPRGHSAVHPVSCPRSRITAEHPTASVRTRYCPGGYHPVTLGDRFHDRYCVIQKLGFGVYSTVWLANDERFQLLITAANFCQRKPPCRAEDYDCGCFIRRKAHR